jgi:hypothetical protein
MVILLFMLQNQGNKITMLWTFEFGTTASKAKWNEKKALDRMNKKTELKWDELQAQAQQME